MVTPSSGPSSPWRLLGLLQPEDECTTTHQNVRTICQSTRIISQTTWLFSILVYHDTSAIVLVLNEWRIWNEHFMPAPIEITTITPRVHNSGRQIARATGFCTMMPDSCWALECNSIHVTFLRPIILGWPLDFWKVCALLHYPVTPLPALRTLQTEGSHIVSYGRKVCCVFRRCNRAVSDYEKTGLQTKSPQPFMKSFNRSFIHSFIRSSHEFCYGNTWACGYTRRQIPNHRHPTRAAKTDGNRRTIFRKAPGSVTHDVFTAKRRYITLLSNAQDARDTVLQRVALDEFNVVWD
jgi:hypothetical protein